MQTELNPRDGFPYYFELGNTASLISLYSSQSTFLLLDSISEEKSGYRYGAGKWSIKQVVGHIADHERIKTCRALFFSRQVDVQLWGYDQETLVSNSNFEHVNFVQLVDDFRNLRKSSISFIDNLSKKQLALKGYAGKHEVTLEEFLVSIIGHEVHHINVLKEKYL